MLLKVWTVFLLILKYLELFVILYSAGESSVRCLDLLLELQISEALRALYFQKELKPLILVHQI